MIFKFDVFRDEVTPKDIWRVAFNGNVQDTLDVMPLKLVKTHDIGVSAEKEEWEDRGSVETAPAALAARLAC